MSAAPVYSPGTLMAAVWDESDTVARRRGFEWGSGAAGDNYAVAGSRYSGAVHSEAAHIYTHRGSKLACRPDIRYSSTNKKGSTCNKNKRLTVWTCLGNFPYKSELVLATQIGKGNTTKSNMQAELRQEMHRVRIGWCIK